jgi:CBS domain-containing protein
MNTVRHILEVKGNDIWSIHPTATVFDALRVMADKDVGSLLVMDNERMIGIVSERDYARKIILKGKASKETPVTEIMTSEVFTIHPEQTVQEAMEMMVRHKVRHLPVQEDDRLLGVISIMDVARAVIHDQRQTIKSLESRILAKEG